MELELPPNENGNAATETTEKSVPDEKNVDESKSETVQNNGIAEHQVENVTEDKENEVVEETKKTDENLVETNGTEKEKETEVSPEVPSENGLSETVNNETADKNEGNATKDNSETGPQNDDNDDEDFDINPLLLCPDISMDVDESPVVTTSSEAGADSGANDLLDSNSLFAPLFSTFVDEMTGAEISFNLTAEEQQLREQMYGPNNPIEFSKVHCSACNVHLGSALAGQTNRFVHPLLKVLICKECYHFYMSGEFEKDEDGSELYCRWCGQGGQVLCCTKCEYVFCKKCIRINFGRKKLTEVRDSEEWLCFRCDISQLRMLRAMCVEFFEYVKRETARAAAVGDENYMNRDLTNCCQSQIKKRQGDTTDVEKEVKRPKRKKVEDPDYNPFSDYNENKEKEDEKKEIVPVAGPSGINNVANKLPQLTPRPVVTTKNVITMPGQCPTPTLRIGNTIINVNPAKATPISNNTLRMLNANMRPIGTVGAPRPNLVFAKTRPPVPRQNFQGTTQRFALVAPGSSKVLNTIRMSPAIQTQSSPTTPKDTPKTQPPMKHEWFEKTVRSAARVNSNLSYTLTQLNKAQANAASVEQLAVVHNKLQEILSSSINSLIQIRKNLRTEFIAGIKTIKFPSKPKTNPNNHNDDDDVVIVSSSTPEISITPKTKSKITPMNPPKLTPVVSSPNVVKKIVTPKNVTTTPTNLPSGGYLKVRSFSQLQSVTSECITIPDDEPPKKNVMEEAKDPLADDPVDEKEDTAEEKQDTVVEKEDAPVVEEGPAVEDVPVEKDAPVVNDVAVEQHEKQKKRKRGPEKKNKTLEIKSNTPDKETNSETTEDKTEEKDTDETSAANKEETIETRLSNGVAEVDIIKVKEEPKDKDCRSYIITEKPSPKIRRMLSVKVNLKKTPIIENMVKKEPVENGG